MAITCLGGSPNSPLAATGGLSFRQGSGSAHGEAMQLLSWVTRIAPQALPEHFDAHLSVSEIDLIVDRLQQRLATRLPMAYVLGETWFGPLRFLCDERALIPRSLILEALDGALWAALEEQEPETGDHFAFDPVDVLDLCCGGGSIAIKAALSLPDARVHATDLSADALSLAADNLQLHGLQKRVSLHQGDLFKALTPAKTKAAAKSKITKASSPRLKRFDLILCNPPYVNAGSMKTLPHEFRAEPALALAGGEDGMDLIRHILDQAPAHMKNHAWMLLEIGHEARFFEAAFPWLNFSYLPVHAGEQMLVLMSRDDLVQYKQATQA